MEQEAAATWFYSKSGERHGPVPLDELKQMVLQGRIDPLSDLVWTKGMEAWKPLGEIPELFQNHNEPVTPGAVATAPAPKPAAPQAKPEPKPQPKPEPKPEPKPAPKAEPKPTPKPEAKPTVKVEKAAGKTAGSTQEMEWPGIKRGLYFFMTQILPILLIFGLSFVVSMAGSMLGDTGTPIVGLVGMLLLVVLYIAANVKRLQNLGMSGWWLFGKMVPLLNLWVSYRQFACPAGYATHKKMDGVGIFLAILFWLYWLSIIATVVLICTAGFKIALDSPVAQEFLKALVLQLRGEAPPTP